MVVAVAEAGGGAGAVVAGVGGVQDLFPATVLLSMSVLAACMKTCLQIMTLRMQKGTYPPHMLPAVVGMTQTVEVGVRVRMHLLQEGWLLLVGPWRMQVVHVQHGRLRGPSWKQQPWQDLHRVQQQEVWVGVQM